METYDYMIDIERLNEAQAKIDELTNDQLLKLAETVDEIKTIAGEKQLENSKQYFKLAILPALKDYAEMTCSKLIVDLQDRKQSIVATLQNPDGFDVTGSCKFMRTAMFYSDHIGISFEDDMICLNLVFDCSSEVQEDKKSQDNS